MTKIWTIIIAVVGLVCTITACGLQNPSGNITTVKGLKKEEKDAVLQILSNYIVCEQTGLTAKQFMENAFDEPEIEYEITKDDKIEVSAFGYLKETGKYASISYIVDIEKHTCKIGSETGNVDWEYIKESCS